MRIRVRQRPAQKRGVLPDVSPRCWQELEAAEHWKLRQAREGLLPPSAPISTQPQHEGPPPLMQTRLIATS